MENTTFDWLHSDYSLNYRTPVVTDDDCDTHWRMILEDACADGDTVACKTGFPSTRAWEFSFSLSGRGSKSG
jgi:hypothetical protein